MIRSWRNEGVRDIRMGVEEGFGGEKVQGVMFRNSSWLDDDSELDTVRRN